MKAADEIVSIAYGNAVIMSVPLAWRGAFHGSGEARRVRGWLDAGVKYDDPRVRLACSDFVRRVEKEEQVDREMGR